MQRNEIRNEISPGSEETFEEIAASVAHEIKNPLALAMANISLIKLADSERKYSKQCSVIENELEKINYMVAELVISARNGQIDRNDEVIRIEDALAGVIEEFSAANGELRFETDGLDGEHFIRGDRRRLSMVFSNIIKNASEAQEGKGRIDARVESGNDGMDAGARVVIEDHGKGLSEKDLANAGARYYSTKKYGTGMGVLYCKNTMEQYGGKFSIENRYGAGGEVRGCKVTLEFPSAE
ncbi:MAG: HAMP domain-containing histidine kinase [Defluviitaleaceae bacterium]|nr:HAMP domain-containing histidine kinase [Defluviitaleaceae bacterium]